MPSYPAGPGRHPADRPTRRPSAAVRRTRRGPATRPEPRDAAAARRPQAGSTPPRRKYGIPGISVADPVPGRLDLARRQRPGRRRPRRPVTRGHGVRRRERLEDLHRGARSWPSSRTACSSSTPGSRTLPADARHRAEGSPSASCSTTRAACATSSSTRRIDKALLRRARPALERGAFAELRRQAVLQARPGLALLEHQLPLLGLLAEAVGERLARRAAADPLPRAGSACDRHLVYQPRRSRRAGPLARGYRFARTGARRPGDRPGRRDADRAVHVGRDRRRGRRGVASTSTTSSAGRAPCTAATSSSRHASRRWSDDVARTASTRRASRTASASRRSRSTATDARPLGPAPRLPLGRPLAARTRTSRSRS